jgi:hypothetical protein
MKYRKRAKVSGYKKVIEEDMIWLPTLPGSALSRDSKSLNFS